MTLQEIKAGITIDILKGFHDFHKAYEFARSWKPSYIEKPLKPKLSTSHSSTEAKFYVKLLEDYEASMVIYKEEESTRREISSYIEDVIVQLVKDTADLNLVPEQYRDKVYSMAYQLGHSNGHSEVLSYLIDLVDIFVLD